MKKIIAITQVRLGSRRLPGKILKKIGKETALSLHLKRILKSKRLTSVVVATTFEQDIQSVINICNEKDVPYFQGSMNDVLDRYYQAAISNNADIIVRLTSDCPLIDFNIIDSSIDLFLSSKVDFLSTNFSEQLPDGVDVEIFTMEALEKSWKEAVLLSDREHVTPYMIRNSDLRGGNLFKACPLFVKRNDIEFRITLDYPEDLEVIQAIVEKRGEECGYEVYIDFLKENPEVNKINNKFHIQGGINKMKAKEFGLRYITNFEKSFEHKKAIHQLIPGGAHTYTKGDDQFPELAPAAIAYGKGSQVWDLDGNQYLDCSMGLTSISLGHAYEPVLEKVRNEIERGVNFQRPSIIEKEIAEKFLDLIPCHDMIKFSKNGSTVTTAAVKIARAFTGRKMIAFPSDHPFYSYDDWFIGSTVCNLGVPNEFKGLSVTYKSEDLNSLKEIFAQFPNQIACVISEPEKPHGLSENYLKNAIEFVQSQGALYVMDEMITGFKTGFPGSISKWDVKPDMATWGKGIANGFSFCALTGRKEVMELGGILNEGREKLFLVSTTHGGETHAIAAAIATLEEFKNKNVLAYNHSIGALMREKLTAVIAKKNLDKFIEYQSADWMQIFMFKDKSQSVSMGFKTLMQQEMIKYGVLFQGTFVPCFSHSVEDVDYFTRAFELACDTYLLALDDGYEKHLVGKPTKPVFRKII